MATGEVTRLLDELRHGDEEAAARLWPLVYEELRALARGKMAGETPGQTLEPTALVNEAYMRLVGGALPECRAHFFAAAAVAMRRILVDRGRRRSRRKRGGDRDRVPLTDTVVLGDGRSLDLLDLDDALARLETIDEEKATLVTLRFLLGCTVEETAAAMGISPAKVKKDWTFAKAWLHRELGGG